MAPLYSAEPGLAASTLAGEGTVTWLPRDTLNRAAGAKHQEAIALFREALEFGHSELNRRFEAGDSIESLVRGRAALVDEVLTRVWQRVFESCEMPIALIAVGGYGRGELHPCSDIDIMLLLPDGASPKDKQDPISQMITTLWDIGLEVGHSIRTVRDCEREARCDVTVLTALMESRWLAGSSEHFARMQEAISPARMWPSAGFFEAKTEEQAQRHARYHDTAYNLEPNVKGSPGGLRDIQTVAWVTQRHFNTHTLDQLADQGFLTPDEYQALLSGQRFLWRIRFALHLASGRREDRLLFDLQTRLAKMFGYEDASYTLAVEQFMQRYYRTVKELSRLNDMLLQMLREAIIDAGADQAPTPINERFEIHRDYVRVRHEGVFAQEPSALLEMFLIMQQHYHLRGISASTIRSVRKHLHLIDEEFRQNPRHHRMFVQLLRAPEGVTRELRRMNALGVLGRYIPAFGRVVGRMQFDLFHTYTVDEHTLFVLRNLRRLALSRFDAEFPDVSEIMQALPKPEIAYLGALFHDIAKGRGGDHSELGAVDAEAFCLELGLPRYDARLVAWLVRHHLLLSVTAQKKDISDPEVLHEFASVVGDETHLDYLYVLTVADVRGTNPKLWNSWKASLFRELHQATRRALRRGLENPIDREELIDQTQAAAREQLLEGGLEPAAIDSVWNRFTDEYFLRHSPQEVIWHSNRLAPLAMDGAESLIAVAREPKRGGTGVLIYQPYSPANFARSTAVFAELGLNVLEARLTVVANQASLDTYVVLDESGKTLDDAGRVSELEQRLREAMARDGLEPAVSRKTPRRVRLFSTRTRIEFAIDARAGHTVMELVAPDRPRLLFDAGTALREARVQLHTAKISTIGERAEDVFILTDEAGAPLTDAACAQLKELLLSALHEPDDAQQRARGTGA
ncbi:MAG: [protein-PII] uridylyltransferase [Pseudomonadota bacterium]